MVPVVVVVMVAQKMYTNFAKICCLSGLKQLDNHSYVKKIKLLHLYRVKKQSFLPFAICCPVDCSSYYLQTL